MSATCETCRWWNHNDPFALPDDARRECLLFSDWPLAGSPPDDWPSSTAAIVLPFAGADGGSFITDPHFGCTEHAPDALSHPSERMGT